MIRIGILGAGWHSSDSHGPALKTFAAEHPGAVELAAVCDLDREKAQTYADAFGFARVYEDVQVMLAEETLEGLIAVTPVALTEQIITALLPQRIPLVIEKPPGEDSAATRRLLAVAEQTGSPHMISFNRRCNPALTKARAWLAEAAADRQPQLVIARMLRHNRREPQFVTATACHLVDAVISLLGRPSQVTAEALKTEAAVFTQARVSFADGGRAHLVISPVVGRAAETYEVHGEGYTIEVDTTNCTTTIWDQGQKVLSWTAPEQAGSEYRDGSLAETEAFIRAIETGRGFAPDLRECLSSMLTTEAVAAGGETEIVV